MGQFSSVTGLVTLCAMIFGRFALNKWGWGPSALITPVVLLVTGGAFFGFILAGDAISPLVAALGTTPLFLAVVFGAAQNVLSKAAKYSLFDPCKEVHCRIAIPQVTPTVACIGLFGRGFPVGSFGPALACAACAGPQPACLSAKQPPLASTHHPPNAQMAYIPLDSEAKTKGKAAIEVVGAPLGKSGGSLIQQACRSAPCPPPPAPHHNKVIRARCNAGARRGQCRSHVIWLLRTCSGAHFLLRFARRVDTLPCRVPRYHNWRMDRRRSLALATVQRQDGGANE